MSTATYPYVQFPIGVSEAFPKGQTVRRPLAFAKIIGSNGWWLRWAVLPDTGADTCLFPLSIAIALKLNIARLPKTMTTGIGGRPQPTYYDTVIVDMGQGIVFSAYAGFTRSMDRVGTCLLGQSGFFDTFHVEFRHAEGIFTVETLR